MKKGFHRCMVETIQYGQTELRNFISLEKGLLLFMYVIMKG